MRPKKVMTMRFPQWDCSNYTNSSIFLHVAPSNVEDKLIRTCREHSTCREFFTVCMRKKYTTAGHREINTSRAHVVHTFGRVRKVTEKTSWQRILGTAAKSLKVINAFEREYKWYPLTKVYPVDDDRSNNCVPAVFFLGPGKWTMSPYLFSLYTLMIRAGRNDWLSDKVLDFCNDHDVFVKKLYNLACAHGSSGGDAVQIRGSIKIWDILMANYKELFGNTSREYNWSLKRLSNPDYCRMEGIQRLAAGSSDETELCGKVRELGRQLAKEAKKDVKKEAVHTSKPF